MKLYQDHTIRCPSIIEILMYRAVSQFSETPMHLAANNEHLVTCAVLAMAGAIEDVDAVDFVRWEGHPGFNSNCCCCRPCTVCVLWNAPH